MLNEQFHKAFSTRSTTQDTTKNCELVIITLPVFAFVAFIVFYR